MRTSRRIAVIFFGQPRFIESKYAARSHTRWLRDCDVDFYGHCWFDPKVEMYETAPWANLGKIKMAKESPRLLEEQYPGINIQFESPMAFDESDYIAALKIAEDEKISEVFFREIGNVQNTLSQFYSMHRALEYFKSEAEMLNYDLVVLSRYDNYIWKMESPSSLPIDKLTLSNHHNNFPDLIYVGPWEKIQALDAWVYLKLLIDGSRNLSAEDIKRRAYISQFPVSTINPVNSDVTILRSAAKKYLWWDLPSKRLRRKVQVRTRFKKITSKMGL